MSLKKPKKILIAVGGSGGHLIPSQTVVKELLKNQEFDLLFTGAHLETNPFFDKERYAYRTIASSGKSPFKLLKGLFQSLRILSNFKPALIIGFGSWHTAPLLAAAVLLRVPFVLYASDLVPGRVVRLFSYFASWTGISFEGAKSSLKGPSRLVSWPLREEVTNERNAEEAYAYFNLSPHKKTLLVLGGSQGARRLNEVFPTAVKELDCQIIHLAGHKANIKELQDFYRSCNLEASVKAFEPQMGLAWQIADMAICRAGAMTLAEQIFHGTPAVYIPYPYAQDNHQTANALYGVSLGLGTVLEEKALTADSLARSIEALLGQKKVKRGFTQPTFAEEILKVF